MKLKKLKEMFAWAAFGFVFANMSIVARAEELPEKDAVFSDQEDSEKTDAEEQSGPSNFAEAKENLENAKKEETKAKAEVDNAQVEFDSAQADLNQAKQDATDAADSLNQAQVGKDDAETVKENAEQSVSETEQAVKNAEESLDQVLEDSNISEDDYNSACDELEKIEAEVKEAEQNTAEVEDELNEKYSELEEATEATKKAENDLESAKQEKEAADQVVSDAQEKVDIAQKEYDDAKDATGTDSIEDTKKVMDAAEADLKAAEEKVASGSLGFFQTLAQEGSESANAAVAILTSQNQTGVSGLRESGWAADSWEEFISYTHLGDANDATNLQNMLKVFEYIEECNRLRVGDNNFSNCTDLLVNDALMAIAQLNANWAANIVGVHSSVFNTGENLAWYPSPEEWPENSDPFRGWYDKEKEYYDAGNKVWDSQNGHYLNIVNEKYYVTGYGINTYTHVSYVNGNYAHAQEFNMAANLTQFGYGKSYSLSEYKERFMAYYNDVMEELKSAQEAYDVAKAAYDKAVADGSADANQAYIASKKAALDNAKAALAAAETEAGLKLEALNAAQEVYDTVMKNYDAVQDEYTQLKEKLSSLQDDLQQKQDAYEEALNSMDATFGPEIAGAMKNWKEAKSSYEKALSDLSKAEDELREAEAVLSAAIVSKDEADQSVLVKTDILAEKQQALADAQNVYYRALTNLAIAQADYDRLKPVSSIPQPSESQEIYVPQYTYDNVSTVIQVKNAIAPAASQYEYDYDMNARTCVKDFEDTNSREISFEGRYSFVSFLNTIADIVRKSAHQNLLINSLSIDCSSQPWFSLNEKTLKAFGERVNKDLTIIFRYRGKKYTFTIPAGYDLSLLQDSNGWYGFMYLNMMFGGHEI